MVVALSFRRRSTVYLCVFVIRLPLSRPNLGRRLIAIVSAPKSLVFQNSFIRQNASMKICYFASMP